MSIVKANTFQDATGGSNAVFSGVASPPNGMGFRNRIINGDMRIDQRYNGASTTAGASAAYIVDRWVAGMVGANGTMQRVSTGRTDFPFALRLTGTSSSTVSWAGTKIESVNCVDLVGQSVTISYLAAASAATSLSLNVSFANSADNFGSITSISSQTRALTNSLAQYTVTISNMPAGTANGLYVEFVPSGNLGSGTFTITGVQLEAGTVASPFERRAYSVEFDMCRRYCEVYSATGTSDQGIPQYLAQTDVNNRPEITLLYYPKRAAPSITVSDATKFSWLSAANTNVACTAFAGTLVGTSTNSACMFFNTASGVTVNTLSAVGTLIFNAAASITVSAEL